jgi:hypothetical protein
VLENEWLVAQQQKRAGVKRAAAGPRVTLIVFHPQHLPPSGQALRALPLRTRSAGMGDHVSVRKIIRGR